MEAGRTSVLTWIYVLCLLQTSYCKENKGVDIGFYCTSDSECTAGNGGAHSICHIRLSMCICTITVIGEKKCKKRDTYIHDGRVCERGGLYKENKYTSALECSAKGTWKLPDDMDWYGYIPEQFSSIFIPDKKTSACYDPERDMNSVPEGFVVKNSTIPGAGLGVFTENYIQRDTLFGPYKGLIDYTNEGSGYSWKIHKDSETSKVKWINAGLQYLSNWLRYINMPTSAEMENITPLQYRGEMYYLAFKTIPPGTELFVWYGEAYANSLKIKPYDPPKKKYANSGYAGGWCPSETDGEHCEHDKNTICAYERCLCVPGANQRSGYCIQDGTLGGKCDITDVHTCKKDEHAVCQRGVCVCKNNTSPANGKCIPDGTLGGKCDISDVHTCNKDEHVVCQRGVCVCEYNTSPANGKCIPDDMAGGRCSGHNGASCKLDSYAECVRGLCYCKYGTSQIGQKCEKDGVLKGACVDGECHGQNVVCKSNECSCRIGYKYNDEHCVKDK